MKKAVVSATALALAVAVYAFTALQPLYAVAAADEAPSKTQITIDNFTFGPKVLTVPLNSKVVWINKDDMPHVVASNNGLFRSQALDTGEQYSFTFTKRGTYLYFCAIHPTMIGRVVVR